MVKDEDLPPTVAVQAFLKLLAPTPAPITWANSYILRGAHSQITEYATDCKICHTSSQEVSKSSKEAILQHFIHCAKAHGYIFPEKEILPVEDKQLQQTIQAAQLYDLPLPGYEDHNLCVRQEKNGKIVCAIHVGNEFKEKIWLGTV